MAIKKIEIRPKGNGNYPDILYPKTSADQVLVTNGTTVQAHIDSNETHKAEDATILKKGHVQLSSAITSTDETKAATPKAVKSAKDAADAAKAEIDNHALEKASLTKFGHVKVETDEEGRIVKYVEAGRVLIYENPTEREVHMTDGIVAHTTVTADCSGSVRVSFDIKQTSTSSTAPAIGQIYINGVAVGTIRKKSGTAYTTYTEDVAISKGDVIEIMQWIEYTSRNCVMANVRFSVNGGIL